MGLSDPRYLSKFKRIVLGVVTKEAEIPKAILAISQHEIMAPQPMTVNYNRVKLYKDDATIYPEKPEYNKDEKFDGFGYPVGGGF